ncbi:pyridoxal 5'-phosphate synthase [Kitasatospora sp. CMC57]|uniref:Pyridoxal 5'-phosphate synthase n=1 Tax=Kitasatospora sp. CMC57 TaxID=3231513 RepID=A0AB33JRE6_9ACTN
MTRPAQQSEELATLRQLLRSRPPMDRELPAFVPADAPEDPAALHVSWLLAAMTAELPDAQVVTVSTSDGDGHADARVLVLRDIDPATGGWSFFADRRSPLGEQLAVTPWAALTSYWPAVGRQVRVRGPVEAVDRQDAPPAERGVGPAGHTAAVVGRQSQRLGSTSELEATWQAAAAEVAAAPTAPVPGLTRYVLRAETVEFWQGDPGRRHIRLAYERATFGWERGLLWP